jgi:hypothetical protein
MSSYRNKVKKNVPKVELHSIISLIVGTYKTGKTRLWKEVTETHYSSPDESLLIAFEPGYETWELENIIPIHEEGSDEDHWKVWEYFKKTLVPELVQEAKNGRIIKLIGFDTVDRVIDACSAWIIKDRNKKYAKNFASLQDITESTNGKENGWTILYEELKKPFDSLKNAGYGLMYLGWTKEKETTLYNGLKYNSIELMMANSGRKVFESQASLICCLHNEVIVLDREGNTIKENAEDKKGKEKASNFHETKTVMYFRPSEYVSIAGGRYTELPEKVDYSAENFLQVFEKAVLGQLKKTTKTVEELKVDEEKQRDEKVKTIETKEDVDAPTPDELKQEIRELLANVTDEKKAQLGSKFQKEVGTQKIYDLTDIEQLQKVKDIVKNI